MPMRRKTPMRVRDLIHPSIKQLPLNKEELLNLSVRDWLLMNKKFQKSTLVDHRRFAKQLETLPGKPFVLWSVI